MAGQARISPKSVLGLSLPKRARDGILQKDGDRLIAALKSASVDWTRLAPHILFAPKAYYRKRLYRDAEWEMLLLCWLPGHRTVVHDHGGAWGAVLLLAGEIHESQYLWNGPGRAMKTELERTLLPGEVAVEKVQTIHRNENRSATPTVSLHLYSPPLKVLNSFNLSNGKRHPVVLEDGPSVAIGGRPQHGVRLARLPAS